MRSKRPVKGRRTPDEVVRYHLQQQRVSGLPISAYCRREGFSAWTFYQWRQRQSERPGPAAAPQAAQHLSFVEIARPQSPSDYELHLGDGVSLRFGSARPAAEVASLAQVLRESLRGR